MEDNLKSKDDSNLNNPQNDGGVQKSNECSNIQKEEGQNESQKEKKEKKEKEQNKETPKDAENNAMKENSNSTSNNEKNKRHRRGKNDTTAERTYKCPDCDRCYLSGPALLIHRKTKHGYLTETEKKSRGRPKKEEIQESVFQDTRIKYNNFLNNSTRGKNTENEVEEKEEINLELIKENLNNIFRQCKDDLLFSNLDNIENYQFYSLILKYWEKDSQELTKDFFDSNNKSGNGTNSNRCNSPPLDLILLLYLKELATKTNKEYFWFINKFIVLLREYINNNFKKDETKEEQKTEEKKEYSQICNAEGIPENFNDFFLEFMQPNQYYGLDQQELTELAQHFCFWLYLNKYTHSYLTLL